MLLGRNTSIPEIKRVLATRDIFDKIEFSGITRESLKHKLQELRLTTVPEREVFKDVADEVVVFYWFKNWLHPQLKHYVVPSPKDKRGISRATLKRDMERDSIYFFENGQHNFSYSLEEIDNYIQELKKEVACSS